ncbi:hypothetical protein GF337_20690 [candidate division KSB1 bacterium]|nr:hypothetical protein [candidate division KSB1 bacterium]
MKNLKEKTEPKWGVKKSNGKFSYVTRPFQKMGSSGVKASWILKKYASKPHPFIFIACMPKSGSTFMVNSLSELTKYPYVSLSSGYERNDQNLYLPYLIDSYNIATVTHQHIRATEPNLILFNKFNIKPVIVVRNIFDVVTSIRDHFFKEGYAFPTIYANEKFTELDEESQYDFIIELGLAWYFNFYVSWYEAAESGRVETLWITYEQAILDWNDVLKKITTFYKIKKTDADIQDALNRTMNRGSGNIRLNKGVAGRGKKTLTQKQQEKIKNFARFYPWVDFSKIGL